MRKKVNRYKLEVFDANTNKLLEKLFIDAATQSDAIEILYERIPMINAAYTIKEVKYD